MDIWDNFWQHKKYNAIFNNPPKYAYGGSNIEPLASIGMSCFLDPCKSKFIDNFSVLDYGCGAGILSNFISERLLNFTYYGLEPYTNHGIERINIGKSLFNDQRVFLSFIEKDLDYCLSKKLDCIVLISVFTHLLIEDIFSILDKLKKAFDVNNDCSIVFSCFTDNNPRTEQFQPHIWERFYNLSYISESSLINYCLKNNLSINKHMSFVAQGGYVHEIFTIKKL